MSRRSSFLLVLLGSLIFITQIVIFVNQQNSTIEAVKNEFNASVFEQFKALANSVMQKYGATVKQVTTTEFVPKQERQQRYVTSRFASIPSGVGLGNILFELISILGIADKLDRIPIIPVTTAALIQELHQKAFPRYPQLMDQFQFRFPEPNATSIPFNKGRCCAYDDVNILKNNTLKTIFLGGIYYQSFKYFHHMREKVRNLVTPSLQVQEAAKKVLAADVYKTKIICVHVRRGDFHVGAYHNPTDPTFTTAAIRHLYQKYSNGTTSSIVVMGNDAKWAKNLTKDFKNGHVLENTTPELDLSFSQQFCDNVLITAPSSTFGFWLGYLAKEGATVYYRDLIESGDQVIKEFVMADFYPPDWVKLNFVNGTIVKL